MKKQQSLVILGLCLREAQEGKWHDYRDVILFQKLSFQSVFFQAKTQWAFSNSSGLKSVLEKLRFRDELVWTAGLTLERQLRFHISNL